MKTLAIRRVVEHNPTLKSFYLDDPGAGEPGQFVMLWLPGVDEKPISISHRGNGELELTVKAIGPFTRALMALGPGERLGLRGPFGHGFEIADGGLLVGGGCGVAPLHFLAERMAEQRLSFTVMLGGRNRADIMFVDDYARRGCCIATEDGSEGDTGLVTARLIEQIEETGCKTIYGAGPEPMLLAVHEIARQHDLPVQLSFERYMKCGVGICGQCCLDGSGARVCVEGPVLDDAQLAQVTELGQPHRDATGARPATDASSVCHG